MNFSKGGPVPAMPVTQTCQPTASLSPPSFSSTPSPLPLPEQQGSARLLSGSLDDGVPHGDSNPRKSHMGFFSGIQTWLESYMCLLGTMWSWRSCLNVLSLRILMYIYWELCRLKMATFSVTPPIKR